MARTYPEKKEAAMSHISHHAAAGENPASRKPLVEETPGRKIVTGLFCAGVALSAALFPVLYGRMTFSLAQVMGI